MLLIVAPLHLRRGSIERARRSQYGCHSSVRGVAVSTLRRNGGLGSRISPNLVHIPERYPLSPFALNDWGTFLSELPEIVH
jgi:hypothetical protein